MDILALNQDLTEQLAGAYTHAKAQFDSSDLTEETPKKQQKIRKWILKQYAELAEELPMEANIFSEQNSDRDVLLFLKECEQRLYTLQAQRKEQFNVDFPMVSTEVREAFWEFLQVDYWPWTPLVGDTLQLVVEDELSYQRIITLQKVKGMPVVSQGSFCSDLALTFLDGENRFCLSGRVEDFEEEEPVPFAITFEQPSVEVTVYNACENAVACGESPWEYLEAFSNAICKKAQLSKEYCNPKELEMLPLLQELADLFGYWWGDREEPLSFPKFKQLTREFNLPKAEKLLTAMERVLPFTSDFEKLQKQLSALLCQMPYQPLWRQLFNQITDSQTEYPNQVETLCKGEDLSRLRGDIQILMEEKGYEGTYPNFVKKRSFKGVRLAYSYEKSYFITREKRVECHVYCEEQFSGDGVYVQFVCGTACLKKREEHSDIYDCMFNANGRRVFQTVSYTKSFEPQNEEIEEEDLETVVTIAVKKSQCEALTKEEREYCYGGTFLDVFNFLGCFIVAGGLFGVFMTAGMMLFTALVTLATGQDSISQVVSEVPWGWILALSWVLFGGMMGIVEMLAKRK